MGIVVTVAMLVGLLATFPSPVDLRARPLLTQIIALALLLLGLWNSCWYGLQNLASFWGLAALISGVAMILTAGVLLVENACLWGERFQGSNSIKWIKWPVLMILLLSFLLYSITLIRLNLGYSIP